MDNPDYTNGYWNYSSSIPQVEVSFFMERLREWQSRPQEKRGPLFVPEGIVFVREDIKSTKLKFDYDEDRDVLTIEGIAYHGSLFRAWAAGGLPIDEKFKIIRREDGTISIQSVDNHD